jgi:hypothetical protein
MGKLLINPFNPIGEFHNRGLNYLIANLTLHLAAVNKTAYYIPQDNFPEIIKLTARFGSSDSLLAGCCRGHSYVDLYQSLATFWNNQSGKVDSVIQYSADAQVNTWLGEIWQIPDGDDVSYEDKRKTLLDLEQRILLDSGKPELKMIPLIGLAVAKSSLYYWYSVAQGKFEQAPTVEPAPDLLKSSAKLTDTQATDDQQLPSSLWGKLLAGWNAVRRKEGSTKNILLNVFKEDTKGAVEGAQDTLLSSLTSAIAVAAPLHGLGLLGVMCGTKAVVKSGSEVIEMAYDAYKEIQGRNSKVSG